MISLIHYDEFGKGMGFPSMKESFSQHPFEGKDKIVQYLKNGKTTYVQPKLATDFFTGERIPVESMGLTDGNYSWHSTLTYYVEKYNLRLPKEFEDYVLKIPPVRNDSVVFLYSFLLE